MKRRWNVWSVLVLGLGLVGCGRTVGDSCTADAECGDKAFCINQDYTPGGYCSQACKPDKEDTCPSGSTCVSQGAASDTSACFILCSTNDDCRKGYQCISGYKGNIHTLCVAPS